MAHPPAYSFDKWIRKGRGWLLEQVAVIIRSYLLDV